MTNTPRIYIGSFDVGMGYAFGEEHAYLLYDPDLDGDSNPVTYDAGIQTAKPEIIRGGPESGLSSGQVMIEILPESLSTDKFNGDTAWLDEEAKSKKWQHYIEQNRQLCLF